MTKHFIQRSIDSLVLRHEDYGGSAGHKNRGDIQQAAHIIEDMFEYIKAHDRIKSVAQRLKIVTTFQITPRNRNIRPMLEPNAQSTKVLLVNVTGDIRSTPTG
jgi:hypothetical protein